MENFLWTLGPGLAEVAERQDLASNPVTATEKSSDTRAAPVGAQKSMFGDLQPIPGDALFENTRKWLQSRDTPSSFDSKKPAANLEEPRFKAIQSSFVHSGGRPDAPQSLPWKCRSAGFRKHKRSSQRTHTAAAHANYR